MSGHITGLEARTVLDSRGQPTVEVDCFVDGNLLGRAIVPSGASTGAYEALELRDGDASRFLGKGVSKAVNNVKDLLEEALVGLPVDEQRVIDEVMIELDGTPNKSTVGANAMLGASLACLHAGASFHELPLWKYVGGVAGGLMPVPMLNILNGGAHAASNVTLPASVAHTTRAPDDPNCCVNQDAAAAASAKIRAPKSSSRDGSRLGLRTPSRTDRRSVKARSLTAL